LNEYAAGKKWISRGRVSRISELAHSQRRGLVAFPIVGAKSKSPIEIAADQLREIALSADDGVLIGSEDDLIARLGVSRVTVRQTARLLEREGLIRVRRGINGGYFAARPTEEMLEAVFCAYLETLGLKNEHSGIITTALWVEMMREAASVASEAARQLADRLRQLIEQVPENARLRDIGKLEQECRSAICELIDARYVELLFRINSAFARHRIAPEFDALDPPAGAEFIHKWKRSKLMEIEAIGDADPVLAMMAARHTRNLWMTRDNPAKSPGAANANDVTI